MNAFVLFFLHPGVLLITLLIVGVSAFGAYDMFHDWRVQRKWKIVRQNSVYFQKLLALNARTVFDATISDINEHTYRSRSQTLQDYEAMDEAAALKHLLQGAKRAEIEGLLLAAENNRQSRQNYEAELQQLSSTITVEQCRELGIPYGDFLAMESSLIYEYKLRIPVHFYIVCVIDFSVLGESVTRKTYRFSDEKLQAGISGKQIDDEVTDEGAQEETLRRKQERNRITPSVRYQVITRDGGRCCLCGRSASDGITLEVDHIIPISKGGNSDADNLQTLCRDCNRGKGASC